MSEKSPERLELERRARAVDLKFPKNIGDEKLKANVEKTEAEAQKNSPQESAAGGAISGATSAAQAPGQGAANNTTDQGAVIETGQSKEDAAAANQAAEQSEPNAIEVTGPDKGFRRGGYAFGKEKVTLRLDDLTEDQLNAIENERELHSRRVFIE